MGRRAHPWSRWLIIVRTMRKHVHRVPSDWLFHPITLSLHDPITLVSPEERQTWYVDAGLVERCRLDVGDDERPPVGATESHVRDLGAGYRNLLDHLTRWVEDRDLTPTIVGHVEIAGFVERHAVRTISARDEGKILTRADSAIRRDRVAQDAVVIGLGQIDGGAVDAERDTIGKGQTMVDPLQTSIREEAVEP